MYKMLNGVTIKMTEEEIADYNASLPTDAEILASKWQGVRNQRNSLLAQTDWVVTKASETGVAETDAWKTYRQALRDITTQSDVDNITWPTEPS
tara:strand:+ start:3561 stop:3842 length:282 start_codon:yes stop_codon:yes gene_type:complete